MLSTRRLTSLRYLYVHHGHRNTLIHNSGSLQFVPKTSIHPSIGTTRHFFGLFDYFFGKKDQDDKKKESVETSSITKDKKVIDNDKQVIEEKKFIDGSLDTLQYITNKYAKLTDGALMTKCGNTMVLATIVAEKDTNEFLDGLPLMVDYRVKSYSVGVIPDTSHRREFGGNDDEILCSRVLDRCIRPLFPKGYAEKMQIIATVESFDENNDPLVVAINGVSAALCTSDIPWDGPIGCVRIIRIEDQFVVNPTAEQKEKATMNLLYAGTETRAIMIEANGDEIPEAIMNEAIDLAQTMVTQIIKDQKEVAKKRKSKKRHFSPLIVPPNVMKKANEIGVQHAHNVLAKKYASKLSRREEETKYYEKVMDELRKIYQAKDAEVFYADNILQIAAHDVFQSTLRNKILSKNTRIDGRGIGKVRPIDIDVEILPMVHGSALFSRGDTQALCTVTLGTLNQALKYRTSATDFNEPKKLKYAFLHYEFPPFSVNETGKLGGVNRRMVGHGALAEKAILPLLPTIDEFPYTIRMTSETLMSDGSSSMAAVCGVSLALMDAGVPIKSPVAGVSLGLITDDKFSEDNENTKQKYKIIVDLLGTEDHYGDMDLKVAGTMTGVTAIQLDVKLSGGIPIDILKSALVQSKLPRSFILRKMNSKLETPREELKAIVSNSAKVVGNTSITIPYPTSLVGHLIGARGQRIHEIEKASSCILDVDRTAGSVNIIGKEEDTEIAKSLILKVVAEAKDKQLGMPPVRTNENTIISDNVTPGEFFRKGDIYNMRVTEIMKFGAILETTGSTKHRGFVHISELSPNEVKNIYDEIKVGNIYEMECIQEGTSGKMSRKALL